MNAKSRPRVWRQSSCQASLSVRVFGDTATALYFTPTQRPWFVLEPPRHRHLDLQEPRPVILNMSVCQPTTGRRIDCQECEGIINKKNFAGQEADGNPHPNAIKPFQRWLARSRLTIHQCLFLPGYDNVVESSTQFKHDG